MTSTEYGKLKKKYIEKNNSKEESKATVFILNNDYLSPTSSLNSLTECLLTIRNPRLRSVSTVVCKGALDLLLLLPSCGKISLFLLSG